MNLNYYINKYNHYRVPTFFPRFFKKGALVFLLAMTYNENKSQ